MYGSLWKQISESLQLCLVNKKKFVRFCVCVCVRKEKNLCNSGRFRFLSVLRIVGKVDNANVSKTYIAGCNINNFKMQIALDKLFLHSVNLRFDVYFCLKNKCFSKIFENIIF